MAIHRNNKSKKAPDNFGEMKIEERILLREYSERFDKLRQNAICVSFHKYGPALENFGKGRVDAIASLRRKLLAYEKTGNTEMLVDVANYAMFEFMYPLHKNAHFQGTDDDKTTRPVGTPINMEKEV